MSFSAGWAFESPGEIFLKHTDAEVPLDQLN